MNATDEHGSYPLGATNETPVDLAAVQADDALLDTLGYVRDFDAWLVAANAALLAQQARHFDVEAELERIKRAALLGRPLVAWRRDVDAEPIGELADRYIALDAARKRERRRRVIGLVAAVLAGLVMKAADPDDLLWPLHELLYPLDGE